MNHSTQIKILTLLSQAFIIVGIGHGIVIFGLWEIVSLFLFFDALFAAKINNEWTKFIDLTAILSMVGQVAIISSLVRLESKLSNPAHIVGLALLWLSFFVFVYGTRNDHYTNLLTISCVPFFFCTVWTLFGSNIRRLASKIF